MVYTIKKGDTLSKIAKTNGLTLDQLKKLNPNIKDVNKIYVGQKINIKSNNSEDNSKNNSEDNSNNLSTIGVNNPVVNRSELVKASLNHNARNLQKQLKDLGYNLGTTGPNKDGVDGDWGNKSQAALDDALSKGYKYLNGKLVDPSEQQQSPQQSQFNTHVVWTPTLNAGEKCGVEGCAQYANDALRNHKDSKGRPLYSWDTTGGDAWTRLSKGSAKMIYSGYDSIDYDRNAYSDKASDQRNFAAADKLHKEFDLNTLDPNKTYMVNMFYKGSSSRQKAWENAEGGTTGTHTGNLYFDQATGKWRVSHNIHGTVYDDDFTKIQGSKGRYGVTAIAEAVNNRDYYRENKPIRGWIRDTFDYWDNINVWKKGGQLIPKAQTGLPITPHNEISRRNNGDYKYTTATPEGYDLRSLGIERTYEGQNTYGNSDSLPIAHALEFVNNQLPELANRYNLTIQEARALLGDTQAVMWNESGGGSSKKVDPNTKEVVDNAAYNLKDNNPLYMIGVRFANKILGRGTSEGYGRVKVEDLRDLPTYSKDTEQELSQYPKRSPQFSGLSSFASMAQRYNKLKDMFKDDKTLIFNDNGTLNELGHALLLTSHNQGFDNIQVNYDKYKQSGDINELNQYKNFRYPKLSLQLIKGHNVKGTESIMLPEVTVTASRT